MEKAKFKEISKEYHSVPGFAARFSEELILAMKDRGYRLGASPEPDFLYFLKTWDGPCGMGQMVPVFFRDEDGTIKVTVRMFEAYALPGYVRNDIHTEVKPESGEGLVGVEYLVLAVADRVIQNLKNTVI